MKEMYLLWRHHDNPHNNTQRDNNKAILIKTAIVSVRLSVSNKPIMLIVVMLNVIMVSVAIVAPGEYGSWALEIISLH
jgi:hypothetical protein